MVKKNSLLLFAIRLSILICSIILVLLLALSYMFEHSFEQYSIKQNINDLTSTSQLLEKELEIYDNTKNIDDLQQSTRTILANHSRLHAQIRDQNGNILYNQTAGIDFSSLVEKDDFASYINDTKSVIWTLGDETFRVIITQNRLPTSGESYLIITAIGRDLQLEHIQLLSNNLHMLSMIACVLIFVITIITLYLTQKPILNLSERIQSINSQNLSYRIPTSTISPKFLIIINAFNDILEKLECIIKRQNNFMADIAHEIRTPITNLLTQTQICLNSAKTVDDYKEILYSNLEEYERLSKMVKDMLFLAKADNKSLTPEYVPINLVDTCINIREYFEPLLEEKNITLELSGSSSINIFGDRAMLNRAISNLVSNAIRYTPSGEKINVVLEEVDNKQVSIMIENPGEKIEPKHLSKLFDRFYRIDKSRQRDTNGEGEGAGIGLAIVKSIIEAHNGSIKVQSDDRSTRFIIILPANC